METDELEPCVKIPLKKILKLRKNCVYTLAITNITESTIESNEALYFCFGDVVSNAIKND